MGSDTQKSTFTVLADSGIQEKVANLLSRLGELYLLVVDAEDMNSNVKYGCGRNGIDDFRDDGTCNAFLW